MDRVKAASAIIKELNSFFAKEITEYDFLKKVCSYFDSIKNLELSNSDFKFLKYLANIAGVPHYYDLLFAKFNHIQHLNDFNLNTLSAIIYESTLYVDENIKLHKFQKLVLDQFQLGARNRFFLSATTSFGKTFLIYEIIKKLKYKNIALIFPTIALLSENYERIFTDKNYDYFRNEFSIHTLSDIENFSDKNIYIFTPERYLSFIDKYKDIELDFVFVDEIYKIDNEYLIDSINQENERDTAYRIALQDMLIKCNDILLVGPYIEFPEKDNININQSFNLFLEKNHFVILNYNKYDLVGKSASLIKIANNKIDDSLTIALKGYSKIRSELPAKIVSDIRDINDNLIIYTKGSGTAETQAKKILEYLPVLSGFNEKLQGFINHLIITFKHEDWVLIKALQNKIGIHHGLVPKYIQKEIIRFFNMGYLDVLISTTTITEGVNTSAKNVLVLNEKKGTKPLKAFDAKNIAGRAGRFLYHYTGRVLTVKKEFIEILNSTVDEIKHKNYDINSVKNEIDYFITHEAYLNNADRNNRRIILEEQSKRGIPTEIMIMYKVIFYSDKIAVFDNISNLSAIEHKYVKDFIQRINYSLSIEWDGFQVILTVLKSIIKNEALSRYLETFKVKNGKNAGKEYSRITSMLSNYLQKGFIGSVEYNLTKPDKNGKKITIDKAIRDTARFVFEILKYQLVKYLGIFNINVSFG